MLWSGFFSQGISHDDSQGGGSPCDVGVPSEEPADEVDSRPDSGGGSSSSSAPPPVRGTHIKHEEMKRFDPRKDGSWEDFVLKRWTTDRPSLSAEVAAGPVEYADARRLICLHPSLMRETRVGQTLQHLEKERQRQGGGRTPFKGSVAEVLEDFYDVFEPTMLLVVKKAFALRTDIAARNENRPVPIVAEHRGNFFDAAVIMWASLPLWKKPIMSQSLRELLITEDRTGLQVVLGMIKSAVLHCSAGKVDVWSRMLLRVVPPQCETVIPLHCEALPLPASPGSSMPPCQHDAHLEEQGRQARRRLWEEALTFTDDWKEKVFTTVFIEPTKMYYIACGVRELADNVEVHGASVYLAVLLSTLGARCPRLPFLLDTPISAVSFLDALDRTQISALWQPENLGKPFAAVRECAEPIARGRVVNHYSNFIFNGRQPWQIANSAVDETTVEERRQKLQPYLEQFAWYFSEELLLPRLTQHFLENDTTRLALQVLLKQWRLEVLGESSGAALEPAEETDVRLWLWDLEVLPAEFRLDRAVSLLHYAGVLRDNPRLL